jgi:hypothetical protein
VVSAASTYSGRQMLIRCRALPNRQKRPKYHWLKLLRAVRDGGLGRLVRSDTGREAPRSPVEASATLRICRRPGLPSMIGVRDAPHRLPPLRGNQHTV